MSFRAIVGQDGAVAALGRAIRQHRVAHTYLFAGPRGVGKMTTAVEFARALVCRAPVKDACDKCVACRKVDHGTHPDVFRIAPEGRGRQISIEVFRRRETGEGLLRDLALKPYEAQWKVALIDDAHAMNDSAQNCLLKTLEEPPPSSVFVLVTPHPDALLETITSRSHVIRFALLAAEVIAKRLQAAGVDSGTAQFLARSSGGSMGLAFELASQPKLPDVRRRMLETLTNLGDLNIVASAGVFSKTVDELGETRTEARTAAEWLFDLAALFYRDVAVLQLGVNDRQILNADVRDMLDVEARTHPHGIRAILDTIEEAKGMLRSNVEIEAAVLHALSRIAFHRTQTAGSHVEVSATRSGR